MKWFEKTDSARAVAVLTAIFALLMMVLTMQAIAGGFDANH